jgi:predicted AlkP superfamily phosphohydrolase/phosphomutase
MFLNVRGREEQGIVAPGADAQALKDEIMRKLKGLRDEDKKEVGIREAFDPAKLYSGPYLENGPDLIIGYNAGYRTSWDCASGVISGPVFEDNVKAWSGDHCIDPRLVPGVFFCSRSIDADEPHIVDLAPTALRLFGIQPPAHMDGKPFAVAVMDAECLLSLRSLAFVALLECFVRAPHAGHGPQGDRARVRRHGLSAHPRTDRAGPLPNLAKLSQTGSFAPLGSSIPPQSPVAWSTFITGVDPGQHAIFDFIHRDAKTLEPYLSTTKTEGAGRSIKIGKYQFPLSGGKVELLRRGEAFWEPLERQGVATNIMRMPANFPPSGTATRELSGMGTPDLLGTYGTFSFFTSEPFAFGGKSVSGGTVVPVDPNGGVVRASLEGPDNPFLAQPEKTRAEFVCYIDAGRRFVKLVAGSEERLLTIGEWSDWVPLELKMAAFQTLHAEARFYLKQLDPYFELYASPLDLDPLNPALPISTPSSYAAELAEATGRFYSQGMPEETKGLKTGVLTRDEFLAQAKIAGDEVKAQFHHVLNGFRDGLLFYYFGNVDQVSHMMWRARDPGHPAYDAAKGRTLRARDRRLVRRPRSDRRRSRREAGAERSPRGDVGSRLHLVAAIVSFEQLAARQRLSRGPQSVPARGSGQLRQRRLDQDAGLRARTQRPLHQRQGARRLRHRRAGRPRGAVARAGSQAVDGCRSVDESAGDHQDVPARGGVSTPRH